MSPAKKTSKANPSKAKKVAKPKAPKATPAKASKAPKVAKVARPAPARRPAPAATSRGGNTGPANETVQMVKELAAIVERRAITELIIDTEEMTLTIRRGDTAPAGPTFVTTAAPAVQAAPPPAEAPAAPAPAAAPAEAAPAEDDNKHAVTSPFVGTFYRRPNPDADPYVEVGTRVDKGQVLCIVEAMKLMNEIEADVAGTISAVLVNDAEPVEYGQALFEITPA